LESSFNTEASRIVERIEQGRGILLNNANFAFFDIGSLEKEPTTFDKAWNHKHPRSQEKWRESINTEFQEMEKKEVWEVMKKEDILKIEGLSSANGSSRSSETEYFEQD
jgi:hypothetical protein